MQGLGVSISGSITQILNQSFKDAGHGCSCMHAMHTAGAGHAGRELAPAPVYPSKSGAALMKANESQRKQSQPLVAANCKTLQRLVAD